MGLPLAPLSLAAFIAWENEQPLKHELCSGKVLTVADERRVHGQVVVNVAVALHALMKGSRCQVFANSMKLQIAEDTIVYPDVFVTCDAADLRTEQIFRAPRLVVEVLSPSTQSYDRGRKFALYRQIPSLQEYVLVDPDTREVVAFRRNAQSEWVLHDMTEATHLNLPDLGLSVPFAEVFDGVDAPPA